MKTDVKKLPRGQVELTIELTVEEFDPFLQQAAKTISEKIKIPGFRPGKANYDLIKQRVGEGELWQEALEPAVKKTFLAALDEQKIDSVGAPQIDVLKLAPGNPVIYKATISLLPSLTLADLSKISVAKKPVSVKDEEIEKTLANFRQMYAKEAAVSRPAAKSDKVEIDFETFMDKIPIDHGKQEKFSLVIGEGTFIPGFEDQLIGTQAGETKTFTLKFPDNYHQKNLAGKPAEFRVSVKTVFSRTLPELNDDFAKQLGDFSGLKEIREKITENLRTESQRREDGRLEEEVFEKIIAQSQFDDIPDLLINSEAKKMLEELEFHVTQQGLKFEDYLTHLKKTREQLMLDFAPQAVKRVKSALIIRAVGLRENIKVTEPEIEAEIHETVHAYGHDPEMEKRLNEPAYRDYLKNVIMSKKVITRLKELTVK